MSLKGTEKSNTRRNEATTRERSTIHEADVVNTASKRMEAIHALLAPQILAAQYAVLQPRWVRHLLMNLPSGPSLTDPGDPQQVNRITLSNSWIVPRLVRKEHTSQYASLVVRRILITMAWGQVIQWNRRLTIRIVRTPDTVDR
ncbi:MAG: hypothetical protein Q9210_005606 [Variospora velana]